MAASRRFRVTGFAIGGLAAVVIAGLAAVVAMLSQYVTTESADETTAARAFATAREQVSGTTPLIVYGDAPVVEVEFLVECLFYRGWIHPLMPEAVRRQYGIPAYKAPAPAPK